MPRYHIKTDTRLAHSGQLLRAGETHTIDWPKGAEPKKLGENMVEVDTDAEEGDRPPKAKTKG